VTQGKLSPGTEFPVCRNGAGAGTWGALSQHIVLGRGAREGPEKTRCQEVGGEPGSGRSLKPRGKGLKTEHSVTERKLDKVTLFSPSGL
jgi:hypothetical protein